jgi:hypothetical protein
MPIGFTQCVCAASSQAGVTSDLSCSACLSELMRVCWTEPRNKTKYSQRLEVAAAPHPVSTFPLFNQDPLELLNDFPAWHELPVRASSRIGLLGSLLAFERAAKQLACRHLTYVVSKRRTEPTFLTRHKCQQFRFSGFSMFLLRMLPAGSNLSCPSKG